MKDGGWKMPNRVQWKTVGDILSAVTTVVLLVAAGTIIWKDHFSSPVVDAGIGGRQVPLPAEPMEISGVQTMGVGSAPLAIVVFSDFECPFCAKFAKDVLPALKADYVATGRAILAFRHLPLKIHPLAERAAISAECASRVSPDGFWTMHDSIFAHPSSLTEDNLGTIAVKAGLNTPDYVKCMGEPSSAVERDKAYVASLGLQSTPVTFVGLNTPRGVEVKFAVPGARPVKDFSSQIDELLGR